QRHMGIDIVSRDEDWETVGVDFVTPIDGVVRLATSSPWNTIAVLLDTGDQLQFLHASEVYVADGASVAAGEPLGKTGNVGTSVIHLHVQAKNRWGAYVDPDWVVARARAAHGADVRAAGGAVGGLFSAAGQERGARSMSTSERWLANHAVTELWSNPGGD